MNMMKTMSQAATAFDVIFNKRHPPHDALVIGIAKFDYVDLMDGRVNYQNPWPEVIEQLQQWRDLHGISTEDVSDALYTWSVYDIMMDHIRVQLWIRFKNLDTQTLFNLSWS